MARCITDKPLDSLELDLVAKRRRGAMRIDIVDVGWRNVGAANCGSHAAKCAVTVLRRRGDMVGIPRKTVADKLAVNARTPLFGVIVFLEHDRARAFSHDKSIAIAVVRPRGALWRLVEAGRKRAARRESGKRNPVDGRLRPACHHDICIAKRNQPPGIANRVRACETSGNYGIVPYLV